MPSFYSTNLHTTPQNGSTKYGSIGEEDGFFLDSPLDTPITVEDKREYDPILKIKVSLLAFVPLLLISFFGWRAISSNGGHVSLSTVFKSSSADSAASSTTPPSPFKAALKQFSNGRSESDTDNGDDEEYCTSCTLNITYCTLKTSPVLGGVDVVATYDSYNSSTMYQEIATAGDAQYGSVYEGYTFLFANAENKQIFDQNPTKYLPQWGGFCSYATAAEFCPDFPWSATCFGPSGNWYTWGIFHDKLHFFLMTEPMEYFYDNIDQYVAVGNERWKSWFGDELVLSTNCFTQVDD